MESVSRFLLTFWLVFAFLILSGTAFKAQAEVCNGAPGIDADLGSALGAPVVSGTTVGGGDDFRTSCGGTGDEDRAYVWTAPADGTYSFFTTDPNGSVLAMAFPETDCGGNFECHFPNSPFETRIARFFPAGQSVVLIIDDSTNDGSFGLNILLSEAGQCGDGIDNDGDGPIDAADIFDCVCNGKAGIDAYLGSALGTPVVSDTTVGGGDDFRTSCGSNGVEDRAYVWTSPADGVYAFYTTDPNGAVLAMAFPETDCGGNFQCHFPNSPFEERILQFFPAGQSVVLIVDDSRNDDGSFELNITAVDSETGLCGNGTDDDNDQLTDCADPDCEGQSCDVENSCTEGSVCTAGTCTGGSPQVCPTIECRIATECVPGTGCHYTDAPDGSSCNDGSACTQGDTCLGTSCQSGTPIDCDDHNPCTLDDCNSATGCTHVPVGVDDGNACTVDACDASGGVTHTPNNCDDHNACNGAETCNPSNGQCVPGAPVVCDDGNPCTDDSCVPSTGECQNVTKTCTGDLNQCNGADPQCNPATGLCEDTVPPVTCNDGNLCTTDSCDPGTGCQTSPITCPNDAFSCTAAVCDPASGCKQMPNHPFCQALLGPKAKCQPNKRGTNPVTGCVPK